MKVLVILAIAVLSDCQAHQLYGDESKAQVEVLIDSFWNYIAKATQTADDSLQMIRESQFGQEVNARLEESAYIASTYAVALKEQLPPAAQDLVVKISTDADVLRKVLTDELASVKNSLEPYAEDMKAQIQQRVEQFKQELIPYADSLDSEALRSTLMQRSQELKTTPMTKKVQVELKHRANLVKQMVAPYAEDLREKLDPYTQDIQAQLMSLYQSFVNTD
uniref:Apolipoprotein A-IV-like n=1 Tax=Cynoglossus semilaevis TaxID=244447 RepID=A0A3P8WAZ3_CYNSE